MTRIKGLDSIRCMAAVFVVFAHYYFPLPTVFSNPKYTYLLKQMFSCLFNGPAAVIIFFIISGFCIHYPNINKSSISILPFYTKRLIRIGLPALSMLCLYYLLGVVLVAPHFNTLWSIICEIVYYLLYPLLFYANKYIKWAYLIGTAYAFAILLLLLNTSALATAHQSYLAMGLLTWVVGLPCWLLGCWLAENYGRFKLPSTQKIWVWRIFIALLFMGLRIIQSHITSVYGSNCYTLNAFAIIGCIWLGYEINYYKHHTPNKILENFGKWSYSLYLVHPAVNSLLQHLHIINLQYQYLFLLISCFVLTYVFYMLIEKPAHKIAVFVANKNLQ